MKKQNENHQYSYKTKMIHDIKNMIIYIKWFVMKMIVSLIYWKKKEYFLKALKNYKEKKKTKWAIWNVERTKISHQVNKFLEKSDDKLKFLKTRWEKMKKWMKITSFWWEWKIIYNLKLIAQWLASMKDSEKH